MNTCDTCKWWGWWKGFEDRDKSKQPCNHRKMDSHQDDSDTIADDAIVVENSIDSYMVSGPRFGCVHWESK